LKKERKAKWMVGRLRNSGARQKRLSRVVSDDDEGKGTKKKTSGN